MRSHFIGPALVAAFLLAAAGSLTLYQSEHDRAAAQAIRDMIPLLEAYRTKRGSYPAHLDLLPQSNRVYKSILLILPPPELRYEAVAGDYVLSFYGFPLGPFQAYDSRTHRWRYEE